MRVHVYLKVSLFNTTARPRVLASASTQATCLYRFLFYRLLLVGVNLLENINKG